jgi:putative membrane protein
MKFIMRIIVTSVIAFGLSYLLKKGIHFEDFWTVIIFAVVLALLNAILIILTFPITLVTFGLFLFVINALMILIAEYFIPGFTVDGFWWALLFSFLLSLCTSVLYKDPESSRND